MPEFKKCKAPGAEIIGDPEVVEALQEEDSELEMADYIILKSPRGEFWVTYQCPNRAECGAEFAMLGLHVMRHVECAGCGATMRAITKAAEEC